MELRQLEYFVELCRVRNFTKASENLHVAQPAVTKAIQKLEEELGVQLIDRSRKPLGLTRSGERFYKRIDQLLRDLEDACAEATERASVHRALSVCVSPMAGVLLNDLLMDGRLVEEGLLYNVIYRSSIETVEKLLHKELDLGFVIGEELPPELVFLPLEEQEALCMMPKGYHLLELPELTFGDLREEQFFGEQNGSRSALSRLVAQRCREAGFSPSFFFTQDYHPDMQLTAAWVRRGYGIGFIPEHAARRLESVAFRPVSPPLRFRVGLAYRKDREPSVQLQRLIGYIRQHYPEYVQNEQKLNQKNI